MNKLSVIGAGTAGCAAVAYFLRQPGLEIDWISDPDTAAVPVGESTLINFPFLLQSTGFKYQHLNDIGGSVKLGIQKENWAGQGDSTFYESFNIGSVAFHINANKLQQFLKRHLKDRVNIIEKAVTHDQLDSDYIIDASGTPDLKHCQVLDHIAVDTAYITQCQWDFPKYDHTMTFARPYGWVFGIPLKDRMSVGYLFNSNINSIEQVKQDVENVFDRLGVTPSDSNLLFPFKSYHRFDNYTDRVAYCGNSSFFLEPLEATALQFTDDIIQQSYGIAHSSVDKVKWIEEANLWYSNRVEEIQTIIMLHYAHGSQFDTEFWKHAKDKAFTYLSDKVNDPKFDKFYELSKGYNGIEDMAENINYGTWDINIMNANIQALGLDKTIEQIRSL